MKTYFIGGLGSNEYHALDFFNELNEPVTFLNPYHSENYQQGRFNSLVFS